MSAQAPQSRKEQKSPQDPIEYFPEETSRRIFTHAREKGYGVYPLVSRRWKAFFYREQRETVKLIVPVAHSDGNDPPWLRALLWLSRHIAGIRVLGLNCALWNFQASHLDTSVCAMWSAYMGLVLKSNLIEFTAALPDLSGYYSDPMLMIGQMTQLKVLRLSRLRQDAGLSRLSSLTGLRELSLEVPWPSQLALPTELSRLTALETLGLTNRSHQDMTRLVGENFSRCFMNLKALRLYRFIVDANMLAPLTALTALEINRTRLNGPGAIDLPNSLLHLTVKAKINLNLEGCSDLLQLHLNDISSDPCLTEEDVESMVRHTSRLEYVSLSTKLHTRVPPSVAALTRLRIFCRPCRANTVRDTSFNVPQGPYLAGLRALGLGPTREIPKSLAAATKLRTLDASEVEVFNWTTARVLLSLPKLKRLYLPDKPLCPEACQAMVLLARQAPHLSIRQGSPRSTPTSRDCLIPGSVKLALKTTGKYV